MTESMELASFSAAYLSRYVLAAVRILGAISLNPLLGSARVPLVARLGLGLFITLVLFPPGAPGDDVAVGPAEIAGELFIGLLAGFAVLAIFAAVQFAAALINSNMGLGVGGVLDPSADSSSAGLERLLYTLGVIVFVQIDGHHLFLAGLQELFRVVEVGTIASTPATPDRLAALAGALASSGIKMALPVLAALMLADLGLAILARVAPQLNLFALGLPLKVGIGFVALSVAIPVMLPRLAALIRGVPGVMHGLAG